MMNFPARLLAAFLFFLSGFAALVYQVAWQRMLVAFAGGDVLAITLIVTVFMAGLGCGSLAGGVLADKVGPRRSLMLFGVAEALIAVFGLLSKPLLHDLLYLRLGGIADSRVLTGLVLMLILLVPTSLMGMSLPLLARTLVRELPDAATKTGRLYGVNTLGAAAGALLTTWMLLPLHGIEGSIYWAVVINSICALGVLPLLWAGKQQSSGGMVGHARGAASSVAVAVSFPGLRHCVVVFALSGFIALALEMLWFRLLGVMLKSTAFTFGTLLAVYLGGVGLGSLAGTFLATRARNPARWFLALQCGIGLYAALSVTAVLAAARLWPALDWIHAYLGSYEPVDANTAVVLLQKWWDGSLIPQEQGLAGLFPALHMGLPLLLIGPPTFLMGLGYPLLQKAAQSDLSLVGRRVGSLQAANIVGSMLGAVLVSTCLLSWLGTAWTLRLLVVLCGLLGCMAVGHVRFRVPLGLGLGGVILATLAVIPNQEQLWAGAHGTTPARIFLAEDGAGVSVLKKAPPEEPGGGTMVFVNGTGQSWIPFGGVHSALGALPTLLHPDPQEIAIIGLGSGDTLFSALSRPETRDIVCIEIIGAQLDTLRQHAAENTYPGLRMLLDDPRVRHVSGDGRQHLMTTKQRFDIIEADALRPTSAYSGNLYSEEYFRLLLSRLKPGGFAVTWEPTPRVRRTFVRVFPHVLSLPHILIGSNEPIPWEVESVRLRLNHLELRHHFASAGVPLTSLLAPFLEPGTPVLRYTPEFDRSVLADTNTDLFPRDELELPALWGRQPDAAEESQLD